MASLHAELKAANIIYIYKYMCVWCVGWAFGFSKVFLLRILLRPILPPNRPRNSQGISRGPRTETPGESPAGPGPNLLWNLARPGSGFKVFAPKTPT